MVRRMIDRQLCFPSEYKSGSKCTQAPVHLFTRHTGISDSGPHPIVYKRTVQVDMAVVFW
jgi:hypothetical protein